MRVKELKLHNFRGIKDLHLVFNTDLNVVVLVGVNGVGKSSILDCINLLMKFYVVKCPNYSNLLVESETDNSFFTTLSVSDILLGKDESINEIAFDAWKGAELKWKIAYFRQPDIYRDEWEEINNNSVNSIRTYCQNYEYICKHYLYYNCNNKKVSIPIYGRGIKEESFDFQDFNQWFKEIEDLENEKRVSENIEYRHPLISNVRNAVYSLLGQGYKNLTFKRAINKMTIQKNGIEIEINLLSDGEKQLLSMVADLSRRLVNNSYDNALEADAIVLIDEIELHLHPAWQRMIIPRLTQTFPNCQFIITTHSPQVLSHVDPECIYILDYEEDNVVVKRPENSYGLDSNRILEDILGVSKRPQEIQDRMNELFRFINNNDLDNAKKIVRELGNRIGSNEPELIKAEATIKRREIIGR